jgi:hypothetical protein
MMTSPGFSATQRAVEVLSAPQSQVLACLGSGNQPSQSFGDTDATTLEAAVRFLIDLGILRQFDVAARGGETPAELLALTPKGLRVARLVQEIGPMSMTDDDADNH